jgi:hypothetical protein
VLAASLIAQENAPQPQRPALLALALEVLLCRSTGLDERREAVAPGERARQRLEWAIRKVLPK